MTLKKLQNSSVCSEMLDDCDINDINKTKSLMPLKLSFQPSFLPIITVGLNQHMFSSLIGPLLGERMLRSLTSECH